jgi:hypothetical protein
MVEYDTNVRIAEMQRNIVEVRECISRLMDTMKPEEDLWDNSEIIRKWKISERTLAGWRSKGLINYVKVNGKIWYPKEAREKFLRDHLVEDKQKMGG